MYRKKIVPWSMKPRWVTASPESDSSDSHLKYGLPWMRGFTYSDEK